MKKIVCMLCSIVAMMMLVTVGCKNDNKNQTEQPQFSSEYNAAMECINKYDAAIKNSKDCKDLEDALGAYLLEQSQIEVKDPQEMKQLQAKFRQVEKANVAKFEELGCKNYGSEE